MVARVAGARELAAGPGDSLFVGTLHGDVMLVRDAEGNPHAPEVFAHIDEAPDAGVSVGGDSFYVGTRFGVWRIPLASGEARLASDKAAAAGKPVKIESVRPGNGGGHSTTSLAIAGGRVYAGVGSSCNACTESDPTRATIQEFGLDGGPLHAKAVHIRNAIALAIDPSGTLWAGVAGQDELEHGHPYEIFDAVTRHQGVVDYGWPTCYENHRQAAPDADCSHQPEELPRLLRGLTAGLMPLLAATAAYASPTPPGAPRNALEDADRRDVLSGQARRTLCVSPNVCRRRFRDAARLVASAARRAPRGLRAHARR